MRRLLKIGGASLLALLLIVLVGGWLYLESAAFDRWARAKIVSYLEDRFAMRVALDTVDVRVFGATVDLSNLRIFSLDDPKQPAIQIDHIRVAFTITGLFRPAASFDSLTLQAPRIRVVRAANGHLNLSNIFFPSTRDRKGPRFSITGLAIKKLEMRKGLLLYYDRPVRFETSDGGLDASWRFVEQPDRRYVGQVSLSSLSLAIGDFDVTDATGVNDFELRDNELRFPSVAIDSREMTLRASGRFSDLEKKAFSFDTDVTVRLPLVKSPKLSEYFTQGIARAQGVFASDGGPFSWRGNVTAPLIMFVGFPLKRFESTLTLTHDSVQVHGMRANLHTGLVGAKGNLRWDAAQRSEFTVDASGVSLRPLLLQLGLKEVGIAGAGHFAGVVGWPGLEWRHISGRGRALYRGVFTGFAGAGVLPEEIYPGEAGATPRDAIAFEGNSQVSLGDTAAGFSEGFINLPDSAVQYSGNVTFEGVYDFRFTGDSRRGSQLLTVARLMGLTPDQTIERYRLEPRGMVVFTAHLDEQRDRPHVSAQLTARRIFMDGRLLGDLTTGVQADPWTLAITDGRLRGPGFSVAATGAFRLADDSDQLNRMALTAENVPVEQALSAIRPGLPVSGTVNGTLKFAEMERNQYEGGGQVNVTRAKAYGEDIGRIHGDIAFKGSQLLFDNVTARVAGGQVAGDASIDLRARTARLNVGGHGLSLQGIEAVKSRTTAAGLADFTVSGVGSVENPDFKVIASSPSVSIDQYQFQQVRLSADVKGNNAQVQVSSVFQGKTFRAGGQVGLRAPYVVDAAMDLDQTPLAPYLALAGRELPNLSGVVDGRVTVKGPLERPEELLASADLSLLRLEVQNYQVNNVEPIKASYTAGVLRIPRVTFRGPQTEVQVDGTLSLKGRRTISLSADGDVNLVLLSGFMREASSGGQLRLNAVVAGPLEQPRIVGTATLHKGVLTHPSLPTGIFDAEGSFKFTANQVSIDEFSARTSYGRVDLEGGVFLEGFRPTRWQVNITGSGLRLQYPDHVNSVVDVDIDALRSERAQLLSGAVYIRSADYTEDILIPELVLSLTAPEVETLQGAGPQDQTQLNISVEGYQSIRVKNNLADIVASGDFTIRGTLHNPVLLGSISVDSGELTVEGGKYDITRGGVTFNNPRRTEPVVNFEATTERFEHTITIGIRGPIDKLNMSLRSDPPLPTSAIVGLLALDQTPEEMGLTGAADQRQLGSMAAYGAGALLSKSLGETVEARARRLFGFERFSIDPFFEPGQRTLGPRVTLGKQLTEKLTVTYQTVLGNPEQGQFVSLEYRLASWLTAIGTRDVDGSLAIDFRLKKRF
jgi:translocation and assembly module TamB